ncbi:unnamed protein product [Gadus morhua 'NCC']
MTFKLPYQLSEKVHIIHGPVVWWTRAGVGFSACVQEGRDVGVVRPTHACLSRPLIGLLPLHKGDVFVLGPMADQFQKGFSTTEISGHQTPSQGHGCLLGRAELFDPSVMLPRAYLPITRSLLVLRADAEGGVPTGSSVVAATSEKQLVRFEDGVPRDVCPLPFDAPEDLRVADTGRNGRLIAVSFDQGHVAAVWEDAFQVAARWSLVRSVHVEDFLGCGTEQLLLVFEEEEEEDDGTGRPFERFLLTDLCGISLSSGQKNREGSASLPAGHNHLLTFQALESRLQSGLSVVQALRSDERLKQRVLLQALQALSDMVSGRETILTPPEQEGLFSLWDEEAEAEEVCDEEMQVDSPEGQVMSSGPRLERLWHRFVDDHLVVGAMVTVDGSSPVDCVSLSLLTNAGHGSAPTALQTRSQVFPLPSPSSSSPPLLLPPPGARGQEGQGGPRRRARPQRPRAAAAAGRYRGDPADVSADPGPGQVPGHAPVRPGRGDPRGETSSLERDRPRGETGAGGPPVRSGDPGYPDGLPRRRADRPRPRHGGGPAECAVGAGPLALPAGLPPSQPGRHGGLDAEGRLLHQVEGQPSVPGDPPPGSGGRHVAPLEPRLPVPGGALGAAVPGAALWLPAGILQRAAPGGPRAPSGAPGPGPRPGGRGPPAEGGRLVPAEW